MQQGPSNYPKFQIYGKILSSSEVVCRSEKLCGTPKKDQSRTAAQLMMTLQTRVILVGFGYKDSDTLSWPVSTG